MVPLKCLTNFWKTLEMALFNCEINLLFFFFLKIFISFLKQRFTIFTKTQVYNNKITITTTTKSSLLELFLKAGASKKYTK